MVMKDILQFLSELKKNNNRDWFQNNKERYNILKSEFEHFTDQLITRISSFDKSVQSRTAKDCVFRIYRDVRFSADKSPYKTHFGAFITPAAVRSDIHSKAGYYIHIEPGASMIAGGAYMPQTSWLKAIRNEIDYNGDVLNQILNSPEFSSTFNALDDVRLTRPPKSFSPQHPSVELLKYKSFTVSLSVTNQTVLSPDFLDETAKICNLIFPLNQYLNRALE